MPGRSDLIQQNISRARAQAESPRPQEAQGKSALSSGGAPRSFLGGNYDVYSQLDSIEFQGALGDSSMRGNVAYIRVWKRGGIAGQGTAFSQEAGVGLGGSDFWGNLGSDISQVFGKLPSVLATNYLPNSIADVSFDFTNLEAGNFSFFNENLVARQGFLATTTPTSVAFDGSFLATSVTGAQQAPGALQSPGALGTVRSANPNGFVNTLGNVGRAIVGIPQSPPIYSGQANAPITNASSVALGEMMWQFLFNPSELELEMGPEYKNAETWGVSDKGNSGQPLHWSHNKNAQLKFNSVLLNGFVFGRKVEVLEQGLIELFMARDGAGQHGPHVLEFVWGKRTFGPCVIKNINIKEKMWDEGEVVNAELSFTLEQVPEWTINDGAYVDVARPGRRPLQEEAANLGQQGAGAGAGSAQGVGTGSDTSGGGGSSDQKPRPTSEPLSTQFCTQATNAYSWFNTLGKRADKSWTDNIFGSSEARATSIGKQFSTIVGANRSVLEGLSGIDPKCSKGCPQQDYYFKNTATLNTNAYLGCVQSCSNRYAAKISGSYLDDKRCLKPQFIRPL